MKYTKPQLLNTKTASAAIMGQKVNGRTDNIEPNSDGAYQSDE
jgi:hypothetical protein